jgi:very-short-patch-repair endonuclease
VSNITSKQEASNKFNETLLFKKCKLLSTYKNNRTPVDLECINGHIFKKTPSDFRRGSGCPKCSGKCPEQAKINFVELLNKEGYDLISPYVKALSCVSVRCSVGHIFDMRPNNFKMGHRCPKCAGLCSEQSKEHFIINLKDNGYELLSKYINISTKVNLKCPEGHIWKVTPNDFKNGNRCPHCSGSTGQRMLQEMLLGHIKSPVIYNDRKTLNGLELDIYYPELNIAIEYQGNYWHNLPEKRETDRRKKSICKEKGIKLLEVWDSDFLKNKDVVVDNIIKEIL